MRHDHRFRDTHGRMEAEESAVALALTSRGGGWTERGALRRLDGLIDLVGYDRALHGTPLRVSELRPLTVREACVAALEGVVSGSRPARDSELAWPALQAAVVAWRRGADPGGLRRRMLAADRDLKGWRLQETMADPNPMVMRLVPRVIGDLEEPGRALRRVAEEALGDRVLRRTPIAAVITPDRLAACVLAEHVQDRLLARATHLWSQPA